MKVYIVVKYHKVAIPGTTRFQTDACRVDKVFMDKELAYIYRDGRNKFRVLENDPSYYIVTRSIKGKMIVNINNLYFRLSKTSPIHKLGEYYE